MFDKYHWLYGKRKSQDDGKVLKIVRHYRMNASCMIDDSYEPFHIMLVDGHAPSGKMSGENCLPHHLSDLYVWYVGPGKIPRDPPIGGPKNGYRLVSRDYGPNGIMVSAFNEKGSATAAMDALRAFGMTRECYFEKPNASFVYWKAE